MTREASNSDLITSDGTLTLANIEAGSTIQYSIDGGTTWTGSFTAVEGANTVEVRQTDIAGNTSAVGTLTFHLGHHWSPRRLSALTNDTGTQQQ